LFVEAEADERLGEALHTTPVPQAQVDVLVGGVRLAFVEQATTG
jgi:hypothetical protein